MILVWRMNHQKLNVSRKNQDCSVINMKANLTLLSFMERFSWCAPKTKCKAIYFNLKLLTMMSILIYFHLDTASFSFLSHEVTSLMNRPWYFFINPAYATDVQERCPYTGIKLSDFYFLFLQQYEYSFMYLSFSEANSIKFVVPPRVLVQLRVTPIVYYYEFLLKMMKNSI